MKHQTREYNGTEKDHQPSAAVGSGGLTGESRNLDLLRAVAVLCVFTAHLSYHVLGRDELLLTTAHKLGRAGVLIFFVHTSLVLLLSLDRSKNHGLFLNFYVRRVFRIYPLSIVCILLVLAFQIPYMPEQPFRSVGTLDIISNLLLTQNLTRSRDVIGPLWSLPWEVQMYVALPVIYLLVKRVNSAWPIVMFWGASVLFQVIGKWIVPWKPTFLLQYVPCFLGGVLAFQLARRTRPSIPGFVWPLVIAGALLFHGYFWTVITDPSDMNAGLRRLGADYLMCFALGFAIPYIGEMRAGRVTKVANIIAKYSYGIYLFHTPVMWVSFFAFPDLPVTVKWLAFIGLSAFVPWASYHVLEAPAIRYGRAFAERLSRASDPPSPPLARAAGAA